MEELDNIIKKELSYSNNISIIKIIDSLIEYASRMKASDIHIEPQEKSIRIRFRIDGVLKDICPIPKDIHSEIISRIKILSGLRTDEHHSAQDGRFRALLSNSQNIDIRVSIIPTYHGENIVLRLLSDYTENFTLDTLGFRNDDKNKILESIKKTSGMILITGPTGSGKTTTLYTLIKKLNSKDISIVTIEDPVEYAIENIKQIQVNSRTNLNFANGLRSILRQDPDVIMVGEIRDTETAGIAINTSLTGHLLLSTLHTNDAPTALPRLLDMKIEPFLVSSTVSLVISQRLVRKICENCKEMKLISEEEYLSLKEKIKENNLNENKKYFYGKGCIECGHTGYKGRIVINEILTINEEIRKAILQKVSTNEIKQIAINTGMRTMFLDGIEKAQSGITTIEEIFRVIYET